MTATVYGLPIGGGWAHVHAACLPTADELFADEDVYDGVSSLEPWHGPLSADDTCEVCGGAGLRPGPLDADWMPPDNLLEATSDLSVTLGEVHRLRAENARLLEAARAVLDSPDRRIGADLERRLAAAVAACEGEVGT